MFRLTQIPEWSSPLAVWAGLSETVIGGLKLALMTVHEESQYISLRPRCDVSPEKRFKKL